jgi:hypothetical protein
MLPHQGLLQAGLAGLALLKCEVNPRQAEQVIH